jgi:hypothetical protein
MARNSSFKKGRAGLRGREAGCRLGEERDFAPAGFLFLVIFDGMRYGSILGLMGEPSKSGKRPMAG